MAMHVLRAAKHNRTLADEVCERCECSLCLICAKLVNRWTTPTSQLLESVTTRTHPPFTFAFIPADDDMQRMRQQLILEPMLTLAWHEAIWRCCQSGGGSGLVVDVGGNFGWYTLYSLALGCSVAVFEPIPAYREVLELGVSLNPGFRERVRLYPNVVYDQPGNYSLRVPLATGKHRKKLGMTGMAGTRGVLKTDKTAKAYTHTASSVRLDDLVQRDVCLLKADVEGYEPQVLQTAQKLLSTFSVPSLQLELTRTNGQKDQTCAAIKMLEHLHTLGYDFRQVTNQLVDAPAPNGAWRAAPSSWERLPAFPTPSTLARHGPSAPLRVAYLHDFTTHSTNLVGRLDPARRPATPPPWPSLDCT